MKEKLTTSTADFGSSFDLPQKFLSRLASKSGPGILEEISRAAERQQESSLKKTLSKKISKEELFAKAPKLQDAHQAGKLDGWRCTLILTEGDSAKTLAIAGLEVKIQRISYSLSQQLFLPLIQHWKFFLPLSKMQVIGRQKYGVFPLRGKFLNVRHASPSQLKQNAEVQALFAIIGLDLNKEYKTVKERRSLRYGRVMLMADQDQDGE